MALVHQGDMFLNMCSTPLCLLLNQHKLHSVRTCPLPGVTRRSTTTWRSVTNSQQTVHRPHCDIGTTAASCRLSCSSWLNPAVGSTCCVCVNSTWGDVCHFTQRLERTISVLHGPKRSRVGSSETCNARLKNYFLLNHHVCVPFHP